MSRLRDLALIVLVAAVGVAGCSRVPAGGDTAQVPGVSSVGPSQGLPSPSINSAPPALAPPPSVVPLSADDAWAMLIPGDPASISYPSLAALARDADAVVIASPGALVKGPDFRDEYGNVIYLASLTLNVERVIRGSVSSIQPGALTLRFWLGVGDPGGYDYGDNFQRLVAAQLSGRAIFLLANMAALNKRMGGPADHFAADPYAYQILGGQGFFRDVDARIEPAALSADSLATMAGTWQSDLRGRPFDDLVRSLDAIAKSKP